MSARSSSRGRPAVLTAVVLALLLVFAAVSAAPAAAPKPIYWKSFGKPARIEPKRIDIDYSTGAAWVDRIAKWAGWGSASATAEGTIHLNTCKPYCAAGNFKAYRGRVTLFKVRFCNGQRRYVDVKIVPEGQPKATWGSDCRGAQVVAP